MSEQTIIESPSRALEAVKELMRVEATFGCQKIAEGWLLVIFDPGREYANDSAGQPVERVNQELLGRVLTARTAAMNAEAIEPQCEFEDLEECELARERSAAGKTDNISACPVHGEWGERTDHG